MHSATFSSVDDDSFIAGKTFVLLSLNFSVMQYKKQESLPDP